MHVEQTSGSDCDGDVTAYSKRLHRALLCCCVCLIVYASLYPFTGWQMPPAGRWPTGMPAGWSGPDVVANVLFYMPFGFLFAINRRVRIVPVVMLCALALSLVMESGQAFLPGRVTSLLDTLLNVSGAGLGALAAQGLRWPSSILEPDRVKRLRNDRVAWLGIAALAAWVCAQLVPFVPSLDVGNIKAGLKPLWYALQGAEPVSLWRCAVYVAATAALTVIGASALLVWRWVGMTALGLVAVLPLKVLMVGRQLSPEAFLGTLAGVLLGVGLWLMGRRFAWGAATALAAGYIIADGLQPGAAGAPVHAFNWVPLHAQLVQPLNGLANLADSVWPVLALAYLCARLGLRTLWWLLPILVVLLCAVEWAQMWIPGRYPGITPILIGTATWIAAAAYCGRQQQVDPH